MKIKLYIEGGGESHLQDTTFRAAWTAFFEKSRLRELRKMPRVIRGGGREQTFDAYCTAVRNRAPDELPLLLVDSEHLVATGASVWKHLKTRDGWTKPRDVGDQDAFLMITCMETWLLADRASLQRYFHGCWKDSALPAWPSLEAVEKLRVFRALDQATATCGPRKYAKGDVSFQVLSAIDPSKVETACAAAHALLERLRNS